MFTEAEIRAACVDLGLLDVDTDSVIDRLKENRKRERAAEVDVGEREPPERDAG